MIVYEIADRDKKDREIRFFNSNMYFATYLIIPHYKFLIEIFRLNDLLCCWLTYTYTYNSSILVVINIKYGVINIIWKNNNVANFYLNILSINMNIF